jgi:CDP-glucose 4,6-dehydratase
MAEARPEIVFHLAAQPLVRDSYRDPLTTLATNVMGTAHVLEAVRSVPSVRAAVVITTDKVYANVDRRCHEADALGGHDPYSASKAAAEIVTASYRSSFYGTEAAGVATARAGNVIGGGDWATDRLVPDCLRAFEHGEAVRLRYPGAIRPWQHVLEPLSGYLRLAEHLVSGPAARFAKAWNFGPDAQDEATVADVAERTARNWGAGARVELDDRTGHPRETGVLRLDSAMARRELGWSPRWGLDRAVEMTVAWHRAWLAGEDMAEVCEGQIEAYERDAA